VAYVLSLIALVLLMAIGMTLNYASVLEFRRSENQQEITSARLAAESGLDFAILALQNCQSEPTLYDLPDMMEVVYNHLSEQLPKSGVALVEDGGVPRVIVPSATLPSGQSFSLQLYVSAWNPDDDTAPAELQLVSTGRVGSTSRSVGTQFNVETSKKVLDYAVVSTVRSIIRGNVTINGDICSSWSRIVGPNRYGYDVAWPLDIGHTSEAWRLQENIIVNGRIATTMSQEDFEDDKTRRGRRGEPLAPVDAVRHPELILQMSYNESPMANMTKDDFDTSMYRDRPETAGDVPADWERKTLDYPRDNTELLEKNRRKYKDAKGNWLRGYRDENGAWWRGTYNSKKNTWAMTDMYGNEKNVAGNGSKTQFQEYSSVGNYVRWSNESHYVTTPCPDPAQPRVTNEYWLNGRSFWRARYEGFDGTDSDKPTFKNLHIPMGSHAHFKNCTFTGITYVETDEVSGLSSNQSYNKYNNLRLGMKDSGSYKGKKAPNNVIFENCTFEGPIVSGVPKHYRWMDNSVDFIGKTEFKSSAIKQEMAGATILMPNYNVDVGDFNMGELGSESKLVGLVVGGIVDIRDNAVVDGTVMSMADLRNVCTKDTWYYGSNIGNWEHSRESSGEGYVPSERITITPDPENVLPMGMKRRYTLDQIDTSYREFSE